MSRINTKLPVASHAQDLNVQNLNSFSNKARAEDWSGTNMMKTPTKLSSVPPAGQRSPIVPSEGVSRHHNEF